MWKRCLISNFEQFDSGEKRVTYLMHNIIFELLSDMDMNIHAVVNTIFSSYLVVVLNILKKTMIETSTVQAQTAKLYSL